MAGFEPGLPMLRASDEERERVIRALRDGSVDGRLSYDTFLRRLDLALRARRREDLDDLLADLPLRRPTRMHNLLAWASALTVQFRAAWPSPRLPALVLPRGNSPVFTIGRAGDCDLVLRDMTVSWRHAELRHADDGWMLTDLGSTNGTRANGWRVRSAFAVGPGDCVAFGRAGFRLADHA